MNIELAGLEHRLLVGGDNGKGIDRDGDGNRNDLSRGYRDLGKTLEFAYQSDDGRDASVT